MFVIGLVGLQKENIQMTQRKLPARIVKKGCGFQDESLFTIETN